MAVEGAPARRAARPNVIWVFGDQHRGQALSCMDDANVSTPNIDRMAREGLHFTTAVAGYPLCCPFRGSLLAGRYPHQCVPGHEYRMPPELPTIATAFKDAGYHTGYFGKWHVDGFKEREGRAAMHIVPPERRGGFDEWVGYENNNSQWDCWVHGGKGDSAFHRRLEGYETDCLTDMLLGYLERRAKAAREADRDAGDWAPAQPFFAVLSVQPPHDPYLAPPEYMARHNPAALRLSPNVPLVHRVIDQARRELAGYYAQIEDLDANVGRLLEALTRLGIAEDTYVIFFADHGDMHGSHGQFRKTAPYEESIRIPFVVWRGLSLYGHRSGRIALPVNHVDIAPTTLGLCGLDVPDWMQGADYSACWRPGEGPPPEPDSAYLQAVIPTMHGHSIDRPWRGVTTRDGWKYICLEGQPWMLHNLNEDPYEQANLAFNTAFRSHRRRLHDRLAAWIAETGDEFQLPER
jgi:arylsulfatase A-like enzyme